MAFQEKYSLELLYKSRFQEIESTFNRGKKSNNSREKHVTMTDPENVVEKMEEKHAINEPVSEKNLQAIQEARQQKPEGDIKELVREYL